MHPPISNRFSASEPVSRPVSKTSLDPDNSKSHLPLDPFETTHLEPRPKPETEGTTKTPLNRPGLRPRKAGTTYKKNKELGQRSMKHGVDSGVNQRLYKRL